MDYPGQPAGLPTCPKADRGHLVGPVPAPGTPQDRFAATIGFPRNAIPIGQTTGAKQNPIYDEPTHTALLDSMVYNYNQSTFDLSKQGHNSVKSSGKGPTRPPAGSPATQWLSYECQRRHFNPDVHVVQQADGTFRCTIVIQNHVVQSNKSFSDPQVAKVHTAVKAHSIVEKWPLPGSSSDVPAAFHKKAAGVKAVAAGANREGSDNLHRQHELRARLLKNQQSKHGEQRGETGDMGTQPISTGFASTAVDMTNPIEARAFVEGFKMGQLAAIRDAKAAD